MSLRPKVVDFDSTWAVLKETVEGVITLGQVDRHVWNDRFTYPFYYLLVIVNIFFFEIKYFFIKMFKGKIYKM